MPQNSFLQTFTRALALTAGFAFGLPVWAGPPLICERIDIGNARSLPWQAHSNVWKATDPAYDTKRLTEDTLALLAPSTPVPVRMETIRRAAVYASADPKLSAELTARLTARVLDNEAAGKADPLAWFDAGYWVETLRQASFVYRYDMLSPQEREAWKARKSPAGLDGLMWVRKAVRLGGKGLEPALARIPEYRDTDLRAAGR